MLKLDFNQTFACPQCHEKVVHERNRIYCYQCNVIFPLRNDVPILLLEEANNIENNSSNQLERNEKKELIKAHFTKVADSLSESGLSRYVTFLNWGYVPNKNNQYAVLEVDENMLNKNPLKLLFEIVGECEIHNKKVLDVGCGRGGNLSAMNHYYNCAQLIGLDITEASIQFSHKRHRNDNITFCVGDAEKLPFESENFDAVFNCESSHGYPNITDFYDSVYRVLKPGGYFMYGDILPVEKFEECEKYLETIGFTIIRNQDISENILLSCDETAKTHYAAYSEMDEKFMEDMKHSLSLPGSSTYNDMRSGKQQFKILNLVKN